MTDRVPNTSATADKAFTELRKLSDSTAATGRQLGTLVIDSYEKAVASFVEFEQRAGDASRNDLVRAAVAAHAQFIDEVNSVYIKAVRDSLAR